MVLRDTQFLGKILKASDAARRLFGRHRFVSVCARTAAYGDDLGVAIIPVICPLLRLYMLDLERPFVKEELQVFPGRIPSMSALCYNSAWKRIVDWGREVA